MIKTKRAKKLAKQNSAEASYKMQFSVSHVSGDNRHRLADTIARRKYVTDANIEGSTVTVTVNFDLAPHILPSNKRASELERLSDGIYRDIQHRITNPERRLRVNKELAEV